MHRTHSTKQAALLRGLAMFAAALSMTFADDVLSAIEARALWQRFGM